ncbi:hypothetical protein GIS00_06280 [Nakamurella sp. YIM 132087]|uniref:Septum formation-related domain-containing protein n=1 Tax=Nakamurella alba TaxID=2665158 RepID=A0A7K1FHF2_9ACTN|nr:septum formation family protein [Nakamurella alba]MTD13551.1 hypothetical protein [Nakamurella alba]
MTSTGRYWGALLLLVVVLTAAVVPAVLRKESGRATVEPAIAAPARGQCLTAPLPLTSAGTFGPAVYGPCTDVRFGEIAGVLDELPSLYLGDAIGGDACPPTAARRHLGIPEGASLREPPWLTDLTRPWQPALGIRLIAVGPSQRQQIDGQRWIACVLAPDTPLTPASSVDRPYTGSFAGLYANGVPPAAAGTCYRNFDEPFPNPMDCDRPHLYESFATLDTHDLVVTQEQADADCLVIAAHDMGTEDPTRGGVLQVAAHGFAPVEAGGWRPGLSTERGSYAQCLIRGTQARMLSSSLIGLGEAPIPWTS